MDHNHEEPSTSIANDCYFEKLRWSFRRRAHVLPSQSRLDKKDRLYPTSSNVSPHRPHARPRTEIVLSQLELLKQVYAVSRSEEKRPSSNTDGYVVSTTMAIGHVRFDFSNQPISSEILMQLMQLVRLSNLDKWIRKVYPPSGRAHS